MFELFHVTKPMMQQGLTQNKNYVVYYFLLKTKHLLISTKILEYGMFGS